MNGNEGERIMDLSKIRNLNESVFKSIFFIMPKTLLIVYGLVELYESVFLLSFWVIEALLVFSWRCSSKCFMRFY